MPQIIFTEQMMIQAFADRIAGLGAPHWARRETLAYFPEPWRGLWIALTLQEEMNPLVGEDERWVCLRRMLEGYPKGETLLEKVALRKPGFRMSDVYDAIAH